LFLSSNLPDTPEKLEEIKPNLKAAIEAFHSFTLPQLQGVIDSAGAIPPMKKTAAALTRESRLLSNHIEDISMPEIDIEKAAAIRMTIPKTINSIKALISPIREYLKTCFSANLLKVIPEVLAAVDGQFRQEGIRLSEITSKGGVNEQLFFDESELASIFEELLSNACEAMKDSEKKELVMNISFAHDEVTIRLSDSGRGLETDDFEQVFQRTYSTGGENRGYGLYHARQQVEKFGGRIRIYNNEGRPGATVEFILKTVNNE
jgi:signal transduction histidine kinase